MGAGAVAGLSTFLRETPAEDLDLTMIPEAARMKLARALAEIDAESTSEITVSVRLASGKVLLEHEVLQLSSLVSDLEKKVAEALGGSEKISLCSPAGVTLEASVTIQSSGLKNADEVLAVIFREPITVAIEKENIQRARDSDGDGWIFYSLATKIMVGPINEEEWVRRQGRHAQRSGADALAYLKTVLAEDKPRVEIDDEDGHLEAPAFGDVMQRSKKKAAKLELLLGEAVTARYIEKAMPKGMFGYGNRYCLSAFVEGHAVNLDIVLDHYR